MYLDRDINVFVMYYAYGPAFGTSLLIELSNLLTFYNDLKINTETVGWSILDIDATLSFSHFCNEEM